MQIEHEMNTEIELDIKAEPRNRMLTLLLSNLVGIQVKGGFSIDSLIRLGLSPVRVDSSTLEAEYLKLTRQLPSQATIRTVQERLFADAVRKATRLKYFVSFWIGKSNIDIFFPQLAHQSMDNPKKKMRGLAIEIDGGVHNLESKMRKDTWKRERLLQLGIGVTSIPNHELNEFTVRRIINTLPHLQRLASRSRKRLMSRIHLETLIAHMPGLQLKAIFGFDPDEAAGLLKKNKRPLLESHNK